MLDIALKFLSDELNTYFVTRTGSATGSNAVTVNPSKVVDEAGKYAFAQDSLAATLINLEEERTVKSHLPEHVYVNGQHVVKAPELKLNLYVMFAANFRQYDQALKYLAFLLTYFQVHSTFVPAEFAGLDSRIERLTLELQSPTLEQLNQIWAFLGGKHLPSVIYKLRMVILEAETPSVVQPPLTIIRAAIHSQ